MLACALLRWRCRRIGPPFGPRARYWAFFIVLGTASVSAIVGVLFLAAGRVPAYVGILVPGGLWLSKLPPQRDRDMLPRAWPATLTLPFSRRSARMGDAMQEWCATRTEGARPRPQWIADAAQYYWNQMGRVTDRRARADLDRWLQSITHKIAMVNLIALEPGPRRLPARLPHDADLPLPPQRPPRRRPARPAHDPGPVDPHQSRLSPIKASVSCSRWSRVAPGTSRNGPGPASTASPCTVDQIGYSRPSRRCRDSTPASTSSSSAARR